MDSLKLFQSHNLKFLFSFPLCCVLFSLLSQSLKPFLMQFISYTIDKSYMFLLCNTLLALIALYSTLINTSSSITLENNEYAFQSHKSTRFEFYVSELEITEPIAHDNIMESESLEEEEEEEEEGKESSVIVEPEINLVIEAEEDEEDEQEENALIIIDEDQETEELNKKCEDFIKKMKAAFCSDSRAENSSYFDYNYQNQKSLVLVN